MSGLLRFLAWATVLAVPSWLIGGAYHRALARASLWALRLPGDATAVRAPDLPASHVLGVYAALCLASVRTPLRGRLTALVVGLVVLVAVELATGILAIHWGLAAPGSDPAGAAALRLRGYLTALPAWLGAPVVWLVMLGGRELQAPPPRPATERTAGS